LGGKGGPYRLDAGHTVHQLSDEEKNAVPDHVKKAAREMGLRAFKQRLRDIKMSEYDHKLYSQFSDAVRGQVQALRVILGKHPCMLNAAKERFKRTRSLRAFAPHRLAAGQEQRATMVSASDVGRAGRYEADRGTNGRENDIPTSSRERTGDRRAAVEAETIEARRGCVR